MNLDEQILRACGTLRSPRLDAAVAAWSRLGDYGACWVAAGAGLAVARRSPRPLVTTAAVVWGTLGANYAVKRRVRRERPSAARLPPALIAAPQSHSFPSAHAAMSAASAVHLCRLAPGGAVPIVAAATAMAASRAYLAVHYPSDVAAGALLGAAVGAVISMGSSP